MDVYREEQNSSANDGETGKREGEIDKLLKLRVSSKVEPKEIPIFQDDNLPFDLPLGQFYHEPIIWWDSMLQEGRAKLCLGTNGQSCDGNIR